MIRKKSKEYKKRDALIDRNKKYDLDTALDLLSEVSYANFDPTIELHLNLNVDPAKSDQRVRTSTILPHSTGKEQKILVFAKGQAASQAQKAGAHIIGDDSTIKKIKEGFLDFDVVIAHPSEMPELVKIAKILGPKGKMPSPKAGTVTEDVVAVIKEIKKGKIDLKTTEKEPIIHTIIGKLSSSKNNLKENFESVVKAIKAAKPPKVKEPFIKSVYLSPTMGPSIRIKME